MEFYAAERKKELIPFVTAWMELESILLSEISQAVKDKYHMISLVFLIFTKYKWSSFDIMYFDSEICVTEENKRPTN